MPNELIEREDLKTLLGIGETTLCKLVKNGRLPAPVYLGRRTVWFKESIDKALALIRRKSEANLKI